MKRITKAERVLNRFIHKSEHHENEAYQSALRSKPVTAFRTAMRDGLQAQAQDIADGLVNLNDFSVIRSMQALTDSQKTKLRLWIGQNIPPIGTKVDADVVVAALTRGFEEAVRGLYRRNGYLVKDDSVNFTLTNDYYINMLKEQGNYLLQLSTLDSTTADELASEIADMADQGYTVDEIASELSDNYGEISDNRGWMIARTELANAMGQGNLAAMTENGVPTKVWVAAGPADDEACAGNVEDGPIPVDQAFSSGDMTEPAHPNCECYTDAGEIDLDTIDLWNGE